MNEPEYAKRYVPVFLAPSDEIELVEKLRSKTPALTIVDGPFWSNGQPLISQTIAECNSPVVYFWDREAQPELPHVVDRHGIVRGPSSGVVIQYVRCRLTSESLLSGDIGVGYDKHNKLITRFVESTWHALKSLNREYLESFDPNTGKLIKRGIREFIVGPGAADLVQSGLALKHSESSVYYRLQSRVESE